MKMFLIASVFVVVVAGGGVNLGEKGSIHPPPTSTTDGSIEVVVRIGDGDEDDGGLSVGKFAYWGYTHFFVW